MPKRIAIVREWKTETERRAPVVPADLQKVKAISELQFLVEPSPNRVFSDGEYESAGAILTDDLSQGDFFVGIKEMPMDRLHPGKPHLFFSHTIKGQEYNMPLLRRMLDLNCTLLDFELVRNDKGQRLIFFGRQAGQAGMINTLWTAGQRLKVIGQENPFEALIQARHYNDLNHAKSAIAQVRATIEKDGMPESMAPFVVAITGTGNVSTGAQDVLSALEPISLTPAELLAGKANENPNRVHQVIFDEDDMNRRRDGGAFVLEEYRNQPELYESAFPDYIDSVSLLVTGHFWDVQYPKLVTKRDIAALFERHASPKLIAIGDVSCDPEGGIEVTMKATYPDNPTYIYESQSGTVTDGFSGDGLAIMAVEILPTELALDSSQVFSDALRDFLADVLATDFSRDFDELALPGPFKRAVIAHKGKLTPEWAHLTP